MKKLSLYWAVATFYNCTGQDFTQSIYNATNSTSLADKQPPNGNPRNWFTVHNLPVNDCTTKQQLKYMSHWTTASIVSIDKSQKCSKNIALQSKSCRVECLGNNLPRHTPQSTKDCQQILSRTFTDYFSYLNTMPTKGTWVARHNISYFRLSTINTDSALGAKVNGRGAYDDG